MVDELAAVAEPVEAPAPVPALTEAQIEAMVERKAQAIADKRIAGLMSANDKKVAALEANLRKLQKSFSNDDDDGVDPRIADLEAELARVNQDAADAAYAREYPDVYADLKALSAADDDAARFQYLRQLKAAQAAPPPVEEEVEETYIPTPPVHPNQPARTPRGWIPGSKMDQATADSIIAGLTEWPA